MAKNQDRSLKINSNHRDNQQVPELRLTGLWMKELGFNVGERVTITTREQLLVIAPAKELEKHEDYKSQLDQIKKKLKGLM